MVYQPRRIGSVRRVARGGLSCSLSSRPLSGEPGGLLSGQSFDLCLFRCSGLRRLLFRSLSLLFRSLSLLFRYGVADRLSR